MIDKKTLAMAEGEGRGQAMATARMRDQRARDHAEAYNIGYEDGAAAAHPLITLALGVVLGALAVPVYQLVAARVAAFFLAP